MSELLNILTSSNDFQIKCPQCGESFSTKKANLFDIREKYPPRIKGKMDTIIATHKKDNILLGKRIKKLNSELKLFKTEKKLLNERIRNKPKLIKTITKHINVGQIIEKIIPGSKQFRFEPKDCRALFDPIDYIAFNGLTKNKSVDSITIIEIKSGDATLTRGQKDIKETIVNGNIKYLEY